MTPGSPAGTGRPRWWPGPPAGGWAARRAADDGDRSAAPWALTADPPLPWTRRVSLRTRVTMLAAVGVGVAVALCALAAFMVVRSSLYDELDSGLRQRALTAVGTSLVSQNYLQAIPAAAFGASDVRVGLLTADGQLTYARDAEPPPVGQPELTVAETGVSADNARTDVRTDQRVIAVAGPRRTALVLSQPLAPTREVLSRLGLVLLLVGGVGIVVAAASGTAVARAGLRPVQRLTAAAERVARTGELTPIRVTGDDELARLSESFNLMLGALADSQERQRRLVADAGHELRTPLTSLRTNLELLHASSRPGARQLSAQDVDEILVDVRAQVEELSTLVGDLVELARDDQPAVVHEPLELSDVVERALDRVRRRAGPDLSFDVRLAPWRMSGDANALQRAVLNVLDNAVKWSPPGGTVHVHLAPIGEPAVAGWVELRVADEGPGIAEADRARVFDRFYRSLQARMMPGSGLGLAIVRQVASRHGGAVRAEQAPGGGALLVMRLPGRSGGQPSGRGAGPEGDDER